jgi:outer membrane protein TolC
MFTFISFSHAITLSKYTTEVLNTHPYISTYEIRLKQHAEAINKTQGISDWLLSNSSTIAHAKPAQSSIFTPSKTETNSISSQLSKTSWNSGGDISFYTSMSQLNQDSRSLVSNGQEFKLGNNHFFENQMGVSYSYPLLKNKKGELNKYSYNLATTNKETLRFRLIQDKERFTLTIIENYLDWVLIHELNTLTTKRYYVAKDSLALLQRKFKSNLIDKVDILRQKDYIKTISQELLKLNAQKKSLSKELALKSKLSSKEFNSPTFDLTKPVSINTTITFQKTIDNAIYSTQLDTYNLEKNYYQNSRKPQLDLDVSYAFVGADSNFTDALSFNRYSSYISLIYTKTLYNKSNTADINIVKLKIDELLTLYESDNLHFNIEKEKVLSELQSYKEIVNVNKSQIKLAEQTLIEENKLYDKGKSNLTFVLQAQENKNQSQIRYIQSLLEVHKLTFRYLALTDQLLLLFNEKELQ